MSLANYEENATDFGNPNWVAYQTIVRTEVRRFTRIWVQTMIPPAITMTLYFIIFGSLIGRRIGEMGISIFMKLKKNQNQRNQT